MPSRLSLLCLATLLAILSPYATFAEDVPVLPSAPGNLAFLGSEKAVSVDSALVMIVLRDSSYTLDAIYRISNRGPARTVTCGFPKHRCVMPPFLLADGRYGMVPNNFEQPYETWVDGKRADFDRIAQGTTLWNEKPVAYGLDSLWRVFAREYADFEAKEREEEGKEVKDPEPVLEQTLWFTRQVALPGDTVTKVRMRYTEYYNFTYLNSPTRKQYGEMFLRPDGEWAGDLGKLRIQVIDSSGGLVYRVYASLVQADERENKALMGMSRGNTVEFILDKQDVQKGASFRFKLESDVASDLRWHLENELLKDNPRYDPATGRISATLSYTYALEVPVPDVYVASLTLPELWKLRQSYMAVHGRVFREADLQRYFEHREWYKPNAAYSDSMLSATQVDNIRKVFKAEKRLAKP